MGWERTFHYKQDTLSYVMFHYTSVPNFSLKCLDLRFTVMILLILFTNVNGQKFSESPQAVPHCPQVEFEQAEGVSLYLPFQGYYRS